MFCFHHAYRDTVLLTHFFAALLLFCVNTLFDHRTRALSIIAADDTLNVSSSRWRRGYERYTVDQKTACERRRCSRGYDLFGTVGAWEEQRCD